MKVIKRDGRETRYSKNNIEKAVFRAALEVNNDETESHKVGNEIAIVTDNMLRERFKKPTVEDIQDIIEENLMSLGYYDIAKAYILYREKQKLRREGSWLEGELPKSIWENKYRYNNETQDEFLKRVSSNDDKVKKLIKNKMFCPAGRILANRGLQKDGKKVTYSNCYVNPKPEDNIESIFNTAAQLARTFSYGGGSGIDISNLRPKGSKVNNAARTTSGACSFMNLYDVTSSIIGQKGRRAALMISMSINHPDIEDFIDIKNDLDKVTKANISLRMKDKFMKAVKKDKDYELVFYVNDTGEVIKKKVNSRKIFNKIAYSNWRMAEPGMLFWDKMEDWCIASEDSSFEYAGVNPCIAPGTLVNTSNGVADVECMVEGDTIQTVLGSGEVDEITTYEDKPIFKVEFSDGGEVLCTEGHQFQAMKKGTNKSGSCKYDFIRLSDLEVGDYVRLYPGKPSNNTVKMLGLNSYGLTDREYGFLVGILLGDGCITEGTKERKSLKISSNKDEVEWNNIIKNLLTKLGCNPIEDIGRKDTKSMNININGKGNLYNIVDELDLWGTSHTKRLPRILLNGNKDILSGIIDGYISTDGNVNTKSNHPSVRISSCNKKLLQDTRNVFLLLGMVTSFSTTKRKGNHYIDGRLISGTDRHTLSVSGNSIMTIYNEVNLTKPKDKRRLKELMLNYRLTGNTWKARIKSIEPYGNSKVYDLHEPLSDTWITNGYVSRGCGEEPLPVGGSCLLSSINLSEFVVNPFKESSYFDYEKFEDTVKKGVIYLNEALDEGLRLHPLHEQRESVKQWRQIGLGVMGLADMFIKLGIKYGDKKSTAIIHRIGRAMINSALQQSALLAKKDGTYPKYHKEDVLKSSFIRENANSDTYKLILKHGLRNSQLLTIAPTGTISNMFGISGGVEPIFALSYKRKTKSLHDTEQEYEIFTPIVREYMNHYEIENVDDLPDYFVTAHDIRYEDRIKVQSAWQQYIDASISSTINLPHSATVNDIKDLYIKAWEAGLKGVTIYRDGCAREGILSSGDKINSKEMTDEDFIDLGICPDCKGDLKRSGGCVECASCGFSPCSI